MLKGGVLGQVSAGRQAAGLPLLSTSTLTSLSSLCVCVCVCVFFFAAGMYASAALLPSCTAIDRAELPCTLQIVEGKQRRRMHTMDMHLISTSSLSCLGSERLVASLLLLGLLVSFLSFLVLLLLLLLLHLGAAAIVTRVALLMIFIIHTRPSFPQSPPHGRSGQQSALPAEMCSFQKQEDKAKQARR